jgi:hypothetical protein
VRLTSASPEAISKYLILKGDYGNRKSDDYDDDDDDDDYDVMMMMVMMVLKVVIRKCGMLKIYINGNNTKFSSESCVIVSQTELSDYWTKKDIILGLRVCMKVGL